NWHFDLFSCFDDAALSFKTCCCPCVTVGETAEARDGTSCAVAAAIWTVVACFCCSSCYGAVTRDSMRKGYGIPGDIVTDCLMHCCCTCCAIVQENREVEAR
ncbi:hypothetical protein BC830DRAFT_1038343, partial [Chytriomyces sp. MP71]